MGNHFKSKLLDYHIKEGLVFILVNVQWAHDQLCKTVQGLQGEYYGMLTKCGSPLSDIFFFDPRDITRYFGI